MSQTREALQSIRFKLALQKTQTLLAATEQLADQLLHASGVLQRGIDPRQLKLSPEELQQLHEQANKASLGLTHDNKPFWPIDT